MFEMLLMLCIVLVQSSRVHIFVMTLPKAYAVVSYQKKLNAVPPVLLKI